MKQFLCIFISLMIFITGCSSTHYLTYPSKIRNEIEGEKVSITLANGELIKGKIIEIVTDSSAYVKSRSETRSLIY